MHRIAKSSRKVGSLSGRVRLATFPNGNSEARKRVKLPFPKWQLFGTFWGKITKWQLFAQKQGKLPSVLSRGGRTFFRVNGNFSSKMATFFVLFGQKEQMATFCSKTGKVAIDFKSGREKNFQGKQQLFFQNGNFFVLFGQKQQMATFC